MPPPARLPARGFFDDPLAIAAVVALVVVGIVVVVDIVTDGSLDPGILALFVSVFGPLTPALILRSREGTKR
jgi:hypothetical protein